MRFRLDSTELKLYLLLVVLFSLSECAPSRSFTEESSLPEPSPSPIVRSAPTVSLCELVNDPERYKDKFIRVQAIAITLHESQYIYDSSCYKKNALTWLDFGNDESYEVLNEKLRALQEPGKPKRLCITALGRFDGPAKEGFGHLGQFKYRFVIEAVEDSKSVPDEIPWPWNLK